MGRDKATLVVDGKPMAVRVADALWESGCHPVECQGGDVEAMAQYGLDGCVDDEPGQGPVAGIVQAMRRHPGADVVVSACDLVDLDAQTISALVGTAVQRNDVDACVAVSGGQRHLVAYLRARAVDRIDGIVAYLDALDRLSVVDVEVGAGSVVNLNSPEDIEARDRVPGV